MTSTSTLTDQQLQLLHFIKDVWPDYTKWPNTINNTIEEEFIAGNRTKIVLNKIRNEFVEWLKTQSTYTYGYPYITEKIFTMGSDGLHNPVLMYGYVIKKFKYINGIREYDIKQETFKVETL